MRFYACLLVAALAGCGGSVITAPEADSSEGSGGSGGSGTNASGAGAAPDPGPDDAEPSEMVPPGQTYSQTSCVEGGLQLFVEIWPDAVSACAPPPDVETPTVTLPIGFPFDVTLPTIEPKPRSWSVIGGGSSALDVVASLRAAGADRRWRRH